MDILFKSQKLAKLCNSQKNARKQWGTKCGDLVIRRLQELQASENLAIAHNLPYANCHPLKQNRKGQYAVDVEQPYRLIFEPANIPVPKTGDDGIDLPQVTIIRILEVTDYHE